MALPKIHLYIRCYVKDRKTLQTLKEIIRKTLIAKKKSNYRFNIYVAHDKALSKELRDDTMNTSKFLIENDIGFLEEYARGAGYAFINILEESASAASIDKSKFVIFVIDGDGQFPIDDSQFLKDIQKLARKVVKEDVLLGVGQRTKIMLGKGRFGVYREIDEVLHTLFVRGQLKLPDTKKLGIPRAYKELGDSVPGCYCVNALHKKYPQLLKEIINDGIKSDLLRFTGDFYIVMKTSQLSKLVSEVVNTSSNPPGQFRLGDIRLKSKQLLATSLKNEYSKFLHSKKTWKILEKYFSPEDIQFVKNLILNKA